MLREALQVSKMSWWLQIVTKNLFQDLPPRGSRKTHTLEATDCRCCIAQYVVRKVYFSAQPNNRKLILNIQKYYPI